MQKIKILLADDELLFRKGIAFLLEREKNIEIVFEASDGSEILNYLKQNKIHPDIILMDLKMPNLNGVEATKIIQKDFPNIKIIALTSYDSKSFINNMIQVGASSYLIKNATPTEMIFTINEVAKNGFYYNDNVLKLIKECGETSNSKTLKTNLDEDFLTSREKEVLELLCKQFNTQEIADKIFISPRTVEGHRINLLQKTDCKNIAGLVVYAIQNKIIDIGGLIV
jgi:DNA-binding NarL/FixJ family response regulator